MEQKNYESPTKTPIVQEIIMSNRIGAISVLLAKEMIILQFHSLRINQSNF